MAVDSKHPDYTAHQTEWKLMRDTERGPLAISDAGEIYLPKPSGFISQEDKGVALYGAYKQRARFPDIVSPAIRGMVGLIHRKEAQIEMPDAMLPLTEKCTKEGLTLDAFHMTITQELLRTGRFGVLADAAPEGSDIPFLAGYTTEAIINWSKEGDFFVLDETGLVRQGFEWVKQDKFRVLEMVSGRYQQTVYDSAVEDGGTAIPVSTKGNGVLEDIPFVVGNPNEITQEIGEIPLIGVSRASIAIYQLDADYRLQLFMSGQETLVLSGADEVPAYVGASVVLKLPKEATAAYVGPSGEGISAHKEAIADAKQDAVASGAQLFDTKQSGQESGEALRLRFGAAAATLTSIAQTSAAMLERALRNIAIFMNLDPEAVVVKPNLRFVETVMTPADAKALMELWMGAAISKETLFENLQRGDIISEEKEFADEEELIAGDELDRAAKADEAMQRARDAAIPPDDGSNPIDGPPNPKPPGNAPPAGGA